MDNLDADKENPSSFEVPLLPNRSKSRRFPRRYRSCTPDERVHWQLVDLQGSIGGTGTVHVLVLVPTCIHAPFPGKTYKRTTTRHPSVLICTHPTVTSMMRPVDDLPWRQGPVPVASVCNMLATGVGHFFCQLRKLLRRNWGVTFWPNCNSADIIFAVFLLCQIEFRQKGLLVRYGTTQATIQSPFQVLTPYDTTQATTYAVRF